MFKMEIEFDRNILESEGYNYEHTMNLLCNNFKRAGFIEELKEEAHLIYRGTDSPNDFSNLTSIYAGLVEQQWFKNCVTKWNLYTNDKIGINEFVYAGDYIEAAKEGGLW